MPEGRNAEFVIRPATDADRVQAAKLMAAVAEERDGIATEPPVDIEERAAAFNPAGIFLAEADGQIVGSLNVAVSRFGFGEIGTWVGRPAVARARCRLSIDGSRDRVGARARPS